MPEKNLMKLVDKGVVKHLRSEQVGNGGGQGGRGEGGIKICEDIWHEFVLIAKYLYRENPEAEIADIFEFVRKYDLGGEEISPGLLKRVTREVETECGPF